MNNDCVTRPLERSELREMVEGIDSGYDPMFDIAFSHGRALIVADTAGDPQRIRR
jgi:hypothetical protein